MPTGLGAALAAGVRRVVYSDEAISKGQAVALVTNATAPTLDSLDDKVIEVELYDAGNSKFYGVAAEDIEAGKNGEVVVDGPVMAQAGAAVSAGAVVQAQNDSKFDPYSAGAKHGLALEDASGDTVLFLIEVSNKNYTFGV